MSESTDSAKILDGARFTFIAPKQLDGTREETLRRIADGGNCECRELLAALYHERGRSMSAASKCSVLQSQLAAKEEEIKLISKTLENWPVTLDNSYQKGRRDALEEAANVAESMDWNASNPHRNEYVEAFEDGCQSQNERIASAIRDRALITHPEAKEPKPPLAQQDGPNRREIFGHDD